MESIFIPRVGPTISIRDDFFVRLDCCDLGDIMNILMYESLF